MHLELTFLDVLRLCLSEDFISQYLPAVPYSDPPRPPWTAVSPPGPHVCSSRSTALISLLLRVCPQALFSVHAWLLGCCEVWDATKSEYCREDWAHEPEHPQAHPAPAPGSRPTSGKHREQSEQGGVQWGAEAGMTAPRGSPYARSAGEALTSLAMSLPAAGCAQFPLASYLWGHIEMRSRMKQGIRGGQWGDGRGGQVRSRPLCHTNCHTQCDTKKTQCHTITHTVINAYSPTVIQT